MNYAFHVWLSQYFGWDAADDIMTAMPGLIEKVRDSIKSVVKGFKLSKSLNSEFKKAVSKVMFSTKKQRNEVLKAIKKVARRQGIKFATKGYILEDELFEK